MGGPYCACLVVRFKPVRDEARGSYAERWVCEECGAEFVRKPQAEDVIDPGACFDVERWRGMLQSGIELCDRVAGKQGGYDFASSVQGKLASMLKHLEARGRLTDRQMQAAMNMVRALREWCHLRWDDPHWDPNMDPSGDRPDDDPWDYDDH